MTPADDFSSFHVSTCLHDGDSREHVLILGDSFGAQLYSGLSTVFPNIEFWQTTAGNCLPFVNEPVPPVNAPNCLKLSALVYGDFLLHHHPNKVLLAAHGGEQVMPEPGHTIAWLHQHGISVVVFGEGMEYDVALPGVLFDAIRDDNPSEIQHHWVNENRALDKKMGVLAQNEWKVEGRLYL